MADSAKPSSHVADRQWFIVGRWQEYEGEARANTLRIIAIGAFYIVELVNYHGLRLGVFEMPKVAEPSFHQAVTALAVAWTVVGLGVLYCLSHRFLPRLLKFVSTGCDVFLLTLTLIVASGPSSPLVVGYFLVIALAALRFNLPLVRFATVAAMAGYLCVLGYAKWFAVDLRVPRYHQIIFLLALALTGIVLGQVIRRVRHLAREYADRLAAAGKRDSDGGRP
jgi:hypothetical protein